MALTTFQQPSPDAELVRCRWWGRVHPVGVAASGEARITYTGDLPMLDDDPDMPIGLYWQDQTVDITIVQKEILGQPAEVGYFEIPLLDSNHPALKGGGAPYECTVTLDNARSPKTFRFYVDRTAPGGMVFLNRGEISTATMTMSSPVPVVTWWELKTANDAIYQLRSQVNALVSSGATGGTDPGTTAAIQASVMATVTGNVQIDSVNSKVVVVTNQAEVQAAVKNSLDNRVAVDAVQGFTAQQQALGRANLGLDEILDLGDDIDYVVAYKANRDAAVGV